MIRDDEEAPLNPQSSILSPHSSILSYPRDLNPFSPLSLQQQVRFFRFISSISLAFLLALPPVLNTAHEWFHLQENHCHDTSSLHLHSVQHHCDLCDAFTAQVFIAPSCKVQKNVRQEFQDKLPEYSGLAHRRTVSATLLRGPPGIC
ncbi:MAG TPA: hypothetical protein PKM27_10080 [Saprospiraceae bacterium]|nr:hypothetical protein [Saprospiraceae bacterium]HNT19049.1 hypothetical protein [Saprospiraceae bacterium]